MAAKRPRSRASAGNDHGGRRLVVVVAFDVVNFTALVEADEERVLAAWRALRRAIDPLIAAGGGRIFKALGDGLLVEFTEPGRRHARGARGAGGGRRARPRPGHDVRLELRCAIHMGEVTVEGTDLLGDGINVVSRLQEHAPIGGVLVSAAVMDLIAGRIDAADRGAGAAQAAQHQPAGARLCRRAAAAAGDGVDSEDNDRQLPAPSARRSPCCPSSTSRPRAAPRGSATGWSRTSSQRCRACPS